MEFLKKYSLKNINIDRSSNAVTIEVSCPNKFDENDLACFWCSNSDEC